MEARKSTKPAHAQPGLMFPIILMVWPIVAFASAVLVTALLNFLFGTSDQSNLIVITLSFPISIAGAVAAGLGPYSFIVGFAVLIVLLIQRGLGRYHAKN